MTREFNGTVGHEENVDIELDLTRSSVAELSLGFSHQHTSSPLVGYYLLNAQGDPIHQEAVVVGPEGSSVDLRVLGNSDPEFHATHLRLRGEYQSTDYVVQIAVQDRQGANTGSNRAIRPTSVLGDGGRRHGNLHPEQDGHFFDAVLVPGARLSVRAEVTSRSLPTLFTAEMVNRSSPIATPFTWFSGITGPSGEVEGQRARYVNETTNPQRMVLHFKANNVGWEREIEYSLQFGVRNPRNPD